MKVGAIILGIPCSEIIELLSSKEWSPKQLDFIQKHTFMCAETWNGVTVVHRFFGEILEKWTLFKYDLDVKVDTASYVQREFLKEVKDILKIDIFNKFHLIGVNIDDSENPCYT